MSALLHVQVSYNQGLVRTFVAPREILAGDFADQARSFGRFRSMRFRDDVSEQQAREMVEKEGAVMMRLAR